MWKKDHKNEVETSSASSISILGSGLKLVGDLEATNDIRIDGVALGNISCNKKVMVGETGKVTGDIDAQEVHVMGEVLGDIFSAGPATIGNTAKVKGAIISARIQIDLGADVEGSLTKTGANKKELERRLNERLSENQSKRMQAFPDTQSTAEANKATPTPPPIRQMQKPDLDLPTNRPDAPIPQKPG